MNSDYELERQVMPREDEEGQEEALDAKPPRPEPIHVISLGAGVQSSTMALMAAQGEITPMPVAAVFADTQWEPERVVKWMQTLCGAAIENFRPGRWRVVPGTYQSGLLPFPVHCVSAGDIREQQIVALVRGRKINGERWASLPYFVAVQGQVTEGRVKRQCTAEYKIEPVEKFIKRSLLELPPRKRLPKVPVVAQWRGITTDEAFRLKDSRQPWMAVRYPLALELRMSRQDCLRWMERNGFPRPPRSACIGCPFHNNHEWRTMRDNSPVEWSDAVAFDKAIRKAGGMMGDSFLHRSLRPLDEVDLTTEEDRGQANFFNNECEGMCGV